MTIAEIMNNKSLKRLEKRNCLAEAIINREFNFPVVLEACESLPEKNISLLLEAIEEVSRSKAFTLEQIIWIWQKNIFYLLIIPAKGKLPEL